MFHGGFPVGRANDRPWDTMRSLHTLAGRFNALLGKLKQFSPAG